MRVLRVGPTLTAATFTPSITTPLATALAAAITTAAFSAALSTTLAPAQAAALTATIAPAAIAAPYTATNVVRGLMCGGRYHSGEQRLL